MTYKEFKSLKIKIPAGWRQMRIGEKFKPRFKVIRDYSLHEWEDYSYYTGNDRLDNYLKENNFYIKPK